MQVLSYKLSKGCRIYAWAKGFCNAEQYMGPLDVCCRGTPKVPSENPRKPAVLKHRDMEH